MYLICMYNNKCIDLFININYILINGINRCVYDHMNDINLRNDLLTRYLQ